MLSRLVLPAPPFRGWRVGAGGRIGTTASPPPPSPADACLGPAVRGDPRERRGAPLHRHVSVARSGPRAPTKAWPHFT
ncbi:hypothetical protein NL676_025157 [Syzygium grande]|nr:hypothetical protein NL676_025157 [Syzygium grande]